MQTTRAATTTLAPELSVRACLVLASEPVDVTFWPSVKAAQSVADSVPDMCGCTIYPVEYSGGFGDLKPAPAGSKPRVMLRISGREEDVEDEVKNVTFWHTEEDARNALVCLLVGGEYDLCQYIEESEDEREIEKYLDVNRDLKEEHCQNDKVLRYLMKEYIPDAEVDFHISVIGALSEPL
jgi:hypothetical protein